MKYAKVAVNTPVDATFDYHIPPDLEGKLQPGHLVQVQFRTAMDHAIVLSLHDEAEVEQTKPILARLDPRPVVTSEQIELSWWMSSAYRAPMGLCVWIWLPPGLTGHRDLLVRLRAQYAPELVVDAVEEAVVALLKRRGELRGHQLNLALTGKNWRAAVEGLEKYEVVTTESVLAPPRVRPRIVQTAALAIHPDEIPNAVRALERPSLAADLLEVVASQPEIDAKEALKASGAGKAHLDKLVEAGWIERENEQLALALSPAELSLHLNELCKLEKPLRILNILAREGDAVDVSWIYAQADASLADLKRLEEQDLILLGEQQHWRDSLADKDFVPVAPPTLAPEQQVAWDRLQSAIMEAAHSQKKLDQQAEQKESVEALQDLDVQRRSNPSPAQNKLWDILKSKRFDGYQFRRQEIIERFIVDFYCREIGVVVEVGATGQYNRQEEAIRERYLNSLGLYLLRFSDQEIADDLPDALKRIERAVTEQAEYADDFEPLPVMTHARKGLVSAKEQTPPLLTKSGSASPPRIQGGEKTQDVRGENYRQWSVPKELYDKLGKLAKQHRHEPTPAEDKLWQWLRDKQLEGFKFRRQQPIDRFIVDFYSNQVRLVIEVDGEIHQYTQAEDAVRQAYLEALGLRVIRFTNDEVLHDTRRVLAQIAQVLQDQLSKTVVSSPLPEVGEGAGVGSASDPSTVFLLHGVTGSGKTELYLRAIDLTLALGRSAIFLVPEIALTPQTVRRVAARFPGKTAVVHSALGEGERYDTWRRARDGLVQIVVGARSALFTPLQDIGLIVLDEEHDHSYKHSPPTLPPYYHARDLAEAMMRRNNGIVILGSATPDIETSFRAEQGAVEKLELPRRIMGHRVRIYEQAERAGVLPRYQSDKSSADDAVMIDLPPVQVVDMRSELKDGNISIFSRPLQHALADVLERREQAILFINRRGQSTFVFCRDCGYIAKCPRCDMPLTHHRLGSNLRCHHCGFIQPELEICPNCNSRRIKFFGAGTQQVEQTLVEMFPRVRAVRWDSDTAASQEAHEAILQRFIERKADVMVGTQMVAKGLDLPLVTLVGVVSADIGLGLPDFRAGERTFQILTQVAGRAGRGLLGGRVILQTYQPDNYAISAAAKHDYAAFYQREIAYRREIAYPPFRRLVRILFRFPNETQAQREAERCAVLLRKRLDALEMTGTELIGPAPCFFTRENNIFRWQVLLRGPDPTLALDGLDIPRGWYVDVDPVEVL
ncbi:MAG: primosomal protein N' [Chloroflexi bacterium]|nr:primosomal protein N' [Chloroflexota bacterium]